MGSRKQKEELDGYEEEGSTWYHQTTAATQGLTSLVV